ncbi:alpha/beta hydrolase, partial [Bacillus inaquosorum]|nr:alpha/beta hydrolase [Bacillus inaquosorum]
PHVEKVIFEKSGHQPMLEEPQAFDQSFSKWMDK